MQPGMVMSLPDFLIYMRGVLISNDPEHDSNDVTLAVCAIEAAVIAFLTDTRGEAYLAITKYIIETAEKNSDDMPFSIDLDELYQVFNEVYSSLKGVDHE